MLTAYGRVLRAPHVPALVTASLLGRLFFATNALGTILFVEARTGSYASAGLVAACGAVAVGLVQPAWGRRMDRGGQRGTLLLAVTLHVAGVLSLVALGLAGAPLVALMAAALAGGAGAPPLSAALRALWPALLPDPAALRAAMAVDALVIEAVFIGGPVLALGVVALASPEALLVLTAACTLAGTLLFVAQPPSRAATGAPRERGARSSLASPGLRTLLLASCTLGLCFGALEVAVPAFADEHGDPELGGLVFAAQAVGSATGGLAYGARSHGLPLPAVYVTLLALLAPSVALLALAGSLPAMLPLALVSGLVIAPLTAAGNELVGAVVPAARIAEAYGWVVTALVLGLSAGNALAGALVEEHGWRTAVLMAAAGIAAGAAAAATRRRTLTVAA